MHIWRLILAIGLAAGLLIWRAWGLAVDTATDLQMRFAYASVLLVLVWWGWCLWRAGRGNWRGMIAWGRHHKSGMVVVVLCAAWLHVHEPHRLRVYHDEPTHLASALYMHRYHEAATAGSAHLVGVEMYHLNTVPMVRMFMFPALLSLVHNLVGYRVENVFWLNGFLGLALLALIYRHGQLLGGVCGGLLAVFLLTGLPLLAQGVTSGGYDVFNLVMIAAFMLAVRHYLSQPGDQGLDLMLSTGVVLALCRYESILYLIVAVFAAGWKWRREGVVTLTWAAALSPLAIWPSLTANRIMFGYEQFLLPDLRPEGGGYFGLEYWPNNAASAVFYLFDFDLNSTNSVMLSVLGVLGLLVATIALFGRYHRRERISTTDGVFVGVGLFCTAIYLFVLTHFWSMPTQSAATRFILPAYMVMALASVVLFRELLSRKIVQFWVVVLAASFMFLVSGSMSARATQTKRMATPTLYEWLLEQARERSGQRVLYVADSGLFLIAHDYPSIPTPVLNAHLARAEQCIEAGIYDEVLIMQIGIRSLDDGKVVLQKSSELNPEARFEVVDQMEYDRYQARLVRLIPRPRIEDDPVNGVARPEIRTRFESAEDLARYRFSLLP